MGERDSFFLVNIQRWDKLTESYLNIRTVEDRDLILGFPFAGIDISYGSSGYTDSPVVNLRREETDSQAFVRREYTHPSNDRPIIQEDKVGKTILEDDETLRQAYKKVYSQIKDLQERNRRMDSIDGQLAQPRTFFVETKNLKSLEIYRRRPTREEHPDRLIFKSITPKVGEGNDFRLS